MRVSRRKLLSGLWGSCRSCSNKKKTTSARVSTPSESLPTSRRRKSGRRVRRGVAAFQRSHKHHAGTRLPLCVDSRQASASVCRLGAGREATNDDVTSGPRLLWVALPERSAESPVAGASTRQPPVESALAPGRGRSSAAPRDTRPRASEGTSRLAVGKRRTSLLAASQRPGRKNTTTDVPAAAVESRTHTASYNRRGSSSSRPNIGRTEIDCTRVPSVSMPYNTEHPPITH